MDTRPVVERVSNLVEPILRELGLALVEVTFRNEAGRWILRVTIHKRGGASIDDCSRVSQDLSALLDVEDIIPVRYHLEASSAGLTRPLKEEKDFTLFAGSLAQVTVREDGGGTRTLRGTLEGVEGGRVVLTGKEGERNEIPLETIAKAKLDFDF